MPQVDLETLVTACTGGGLDRKIACETLAGGDGDKEEDPDLPPEPPSDFPPESFWLSKDAEYDWFDRNAFLERNESTKGNSNSSNLNNPTVIPPSNSSSQRFASNLKSRVGIFRLPKTQKTTFVDPSNRRISKPTNISLFPKRSESMAKSVVTEPTSPKVSCMGRVRSKKGCRRSSTDESKISATAAIPLEKSGSVSYQEKGICRIIFGFFRSKRRGKDELKKEKDERSECYEREFPARSVEPAAASGMVPGLGGMQRFASGRRSTSFGVES
ncbi:uncharacterized protein LOC124915617 [Impatiens glandulifera]|uniref:uncharacterized protein LOC124915617 n=1 Tax=Impatiens glandulifera TaxID=253017 RepID=UPI001FB14F43|nr:uncharacterized protein LOC124915617 [Impatiens glandulifera]